MLSAAVLMSLMSSPAMADGEDSKLTSNVRKTIKRLGSGQKAFCYVVEDGSVQGVNPDQPVKIASVMKVLTTLWAVDRHGPNFRYTTKIYYQASNKELHIEGSNDPFFDRDRLYLLLSDLNRAGIKSLNRVTADRKFLMNMDLFEHIYNPGRMREYVYTEAHADAPLGGVKVKQGLMNAFNTSQWWSAKKGRYAKTRARNQTPSLLPSVTMSVEATDIVEGNPLSGKPGVTVFEIKSLQMKNYLKKMNIHSMNPVADELFYSMGGRQGFRNYLQATYGMGPDAVDINTGSGLPLHNPRNDTSISCSSVVRLIRRLDWNLEQKYGMDMTDVVMIAGTDAGATFNDGSGALVVKTGTLNNVKNLAGAANTSDGEVYFGIFLEGRNANLGGVQQVLANVKASFSLRRISKSSFAFDPLEPEMTLKAVSGAPVPAAPVAIRRG